MRRCPFRTLGFFAFACCVLLTSCEQPEDFAGELIDSPQSAPEISGINWNGQAFSLRQLTDEGRVAIVFFGYTYCPDVCPTTLGKFKRLYTQLGERAGKVAVVFVSVDPERDSVEKLARYVPQFDKRFYGVRLEGEGLESTTRAYDVVVQRSTRPGQATNDFYYVDHTGAYFVVDRQGRLFLKFPASATAEEMLPDVQALLDGQP